MSVTRIPLRNRAGEVVAHALVDNADEVAITRHRWHLGHGYAKRSVYRADGTIGTQSMHRAVLGLGVGDGGEVDHINGDRLDNRRANLRITDRAGNQANRHGADQTVGRTSSYRGVCRVNGRWLAQAQVGGRHYNLGSFDDELEAARVASAFRREHMPTSTMDQHDLNEAA